MTVSGKIASLSLERSSNCTKILYSEGVSKYSCIARSLVSIGFTVVKKTAFLPLLRLVPPEINPFLTVESDVVDALGNPFDNSTMSCNAEYQQHYLLNVLELLEGTGIDWKILDSRNVDTFSSLLSLFPRLIFNLQVTIAKHRRTSSSCTLR